MKFADSLVPISLSSWRLFVKRYIRENCLPERFCKQKTSLVKKYISSKKYQCFFFNNIYNFLFLQLTFTTRYQCVPLLHQKTNFFHILTIENISVSRFLPISYICTKALFEVPFVTKSHAHLFWQWRYRQFYNLSDGELINNGTLLYKI